MKNDFLTRLCAVYGHCGIVNKGGNVLDGAMMRHQERCPQSDYEVSQWRDAVRCYYLIITLRSLII